MRKRKFKPPRPIRHIETEDDNGHVIHVDKRHTKIKDVDSDMFNANKKRMKVDKLVLLDKNNKDKCQIRIKMPK